MKKRSYNEERKKQIQEVLDIYLDFMFFEELDSKSLQLMYNKSKRQMVERTTGPFSGRVLLPDNLPDSVARVIK